jgi:transposase
MGVLKVSNGKKYNEEFKREAVRLMEGRGSRTIEQIADDIGVGAGQLYKWRQQYAGAASTKAAVNVDLAAENKRLKKELEQALKERELLKKSIAFFVKENG